jgi:hypothetical protein
VKGNSLNRNLLPIFLIPAGLALAVWTGLLIGEGHWAKIYVPALAIIGTTAVLLLGSRYWLLIPFSLCFSAPVIPLGGRAVELPELVTVVCVALFLIRRAFKIQKLYILRPAHYPFLLYTTWAALIFFHNPIGFSLFGASSGGARFYFTIFLALAAFLIIANQQITNRDCKWILIGVVVGTFLDFIKILLYYYIFAGSAVFVDPLESYSWQQELFTVPLTLVLILFSRYSVAEIFNLSKLWRLLVLLLCGPMILVSGKRTAVISLILYPLIAAATRKEFRYFFAWTACVGILAAVLITGQGRVFHLPLTAQRAVSWLPGRWDSELQYMEGGKDVFRDKLRILAKEKIRKDRWIGTGYRVQLQETQNLTFTMASKFDALVLQMALGSAWHNQWLGYAADFGIPASILLAVIYLSVLSLAWRTYWHLPRGSLLQTMVMYVLMRTVVDIVFSNVSGHSASDASSRWWMYGVLVSIARTIKDQKRVSGDFVKVGASELLAPSTPGRARVHSVEQ